MWRYWTSFLDVLKIWSTCVLNKNVMDTGLRALYCIWLLLDKRRYLTSFFFDVLKIGRTCVLDITCYWTKFFFGYIGFGYEAFVQIILEPSFHRFFFLFTQEAATTLSCETSSVNSPVIAVPQNGRIYSLRRMNLRKPSQRGMIVLRRVCVRGSIPSDDRCEYVVRFSSVPSSYLKRAGPSLPAPHIYDLYVIHLSVQIFNVSGANFGPWFATTD